jgi:signal recognition particle GTPase
VVSPVQQVQPSAVNTQSMNRVGEGSGTSSQNHTAIAKHNKLATIMSKHIQQAESAKPPVSGTVGAGTMTMQPPTVNGH